MTRTTSDAGSTEIPPLMDCNKLAQTWTMFSPNTIRELAAVGNIPVAGWVNGQPIFVYDSQTACALVRLFRGPYRDQR